MNGFRFTNRSEAGTRLAFLLEGYARRHDTVVLAVPRGGVPVAAELAARLHLPLDVFVVRKLGLPRHEELAMGAVAADGRVTLDEALIAAARISQAQIAAVVARETLEVQRRIRLYRDGRAERSLRGQVVILVDDGLATGSTMSAAIHAVRAHDPRAVIVAVPVGSREACDAIESLADTLICMLRPETFEAVGSYYRDFSQIGDDEVRRALAEAASMNAERSLVV